MIQPNHRFTIFVLVSLAVFYAILRFVTRRRTDRPAMAHVVIIAAIVVVGGMVFAKFGANQGWPWWIYYTVPALTTLLLPPLACRMAGNELWQYLVLAFLSSPVIHLAFSFFLDWHEYMPFIRITSLQSLI